MFSYSMAIRWIQHEMLVYDAKLPLIFCTYLLYYRPILLCLPQSIDISPVHQMLGNKISVVWLLLDGSLRISSLL